MSLIVPFPAPARPVRRPRRGLAAAVGALWQDAATRLAERRRRRLDRSAFLTLTGLDDATLRDIGLARADVEWAAQLPLDVNAARALQARKRRNAGNL